jgi:hypothetical protein
VLAGVWRHGPRAAILVGASAFFAAYNSGAGEFGAIIVGLIAGSLTLVAGRVAIEKSQSPVIHIAIMLLFVVPAAAMGYSATLELVQRLGTPSVVWQHALALLGAVAIGTMALGRLASPNPPDSGRG